MSKNKLKKKFISANGNSASRLDLLLSVHLLYFINNPFLTLVPKIV